MDGEYVGTLRVPVSMLTFLPPDHFKQDDFLRTLAQEQVLRTDKKAAELAYVFTHDKFEPSAPENQMIGIITSEVLHDILTSLQLSKEDFLQSSISGNYRFVYGDYSIWCVRGRLSALAAKIAFGEEAWWTVKVFHFQRTGMISSFMKRCILIYTSGHKLDRFVKTASEEFAHENAYSDGAIYRKIRYYSDRGEVSEAQKWLLRLSSPKQSNLFYLLKRKAVLEAFDELLPFIGLWGGLQLGNIHKHLALHCDEQMISYIKQIRAVWISIMRDEKLLYVIDLETVQFLEFKAPSASSNDRVSIQKAMESGRLFSLVSDRIIRRKILSNIMKLTVVIPSIATLHHNMKYFGLGAKILQKHIEVLPTKSRKHRPTLFQNLKDIWNAPRGAVCEVAEGETIELAATTPEVSYLQLFVAALRDFLPLIHEYPLQDRGEQEIISCDQDEQQYYRLKFIRLARNLGFHNSKTKGVLPSAPRETPRDSISTTLPDWRGGKPSSSTFKALRSMAFLPQLFMCEKTSEVPSPCFVLNDFICAFFGSFEILNVNSGEASSIFIEMPRFISLERKNIVAMLKQSARGRPQKTDSNFRVSKPQRKAAPARSEKLSEALKRRGFPERLDPGEIDADMPDNDEVRAEEPLKVIPTPAQTQLMDEEQPSDSMREAVTTQSIGVDGSRTSQVPQSLNSNQEVQNLFMERRKLYQQLRKEAVKRRFEESEFREDIRVQMEEQRLQKRKRPNPLSERHFDAVTEDSNEQIRDSDEDELHVGHKQKRLETEPEETNRADYEAVIEDSYEEDAYERHSQTTKDQVKDTISYEALKEPPTMPLREERRSAQQPLRRYDLAQEEILHSSGQQFQEKETLSALSLKRQNEQVPEGQLNEETRAEEVLKLQIPPKAAPLLKRRFDMVGDYSVQIRGPTATETVTEPSTKRQRFQEDIVASTNERNSERNPGTIPPSTGKRKSVASPPNRANSDPKLGRSMQPKDRIQQYLQRNRVKRTFDDMESGFNEEIRQVTEPNRIRENFKRRRYLENQAALQSNSDKIPTNNPPSTVSGDFDDPVPDSAPRFLPESFKDLLNSAPREAVRSIYAPEASGTQRAGATFGNPPQRQDTEKETTSSSEVFSQTARTFSLETLESTSSLEAVT